MIPHLYKKIGLIAWLMGTGLALYAQGVAFTKENFPTKKEGLRKALKAIREGNAYWEFDADPDQAIKAYEKAYRFNPKDPMLNFKLGYCYLISTQKEKQPAIGYLKSVHDIAPAYSPETTLYLARTYHLLSEWGEAIRWYQVYAQQEGLPEASKQAAQQYIAECEAGRRLAQQPERVFFDNLGRRVNSKYADFGAVLNADESAMLVTSRREASIGEEREGVEGYFEDIFECRITNGEWSRIRNMGRPINTPGHEAVLAVSPSGKNILLYRGDRNGDLYESTKEGKVWGKPEPFDEPINSKFRESSACYSSDGKKIYFTSDREGGQGGLDIWVSEKQRKGWSKPKNLGPSVNSPRDEDGVFLHPNDQLLYFSSNGRETVGGFDVFVAKQVNGEWQTATNLGIPVNSPANELGFFMRDPDLKKAFLSSDRAGGQGGFDLYQLTLLGPEKPMAIWVDSLTVALQPEPFTQQLIAQWTERSGALVKVTGKVLDKITLQPLASRVEVANLATGETVAQIETLGGQGTWQFMLAAGNNYGLNIQSEGYLLYSENFDLPKRIASQLLEKTVLLQTVAAGNKMVLNNIFFEVDRADLQPASLLELDRLATFLTENPQVRMEVAGHTDNTGTAQRNQQLSEERAQAVAQYLIGKGVSPDRLQTVGYGASQPVANNATEEGRKQNRRTEFNIL